MGDQKTEKKAVTRPASVRIRLYRPVKVEGKRSNQILKTADGKIANDFQQLTLVPNTYPFINYLQDISQSKEYFKIEIVRYYDGSTKWEMKEGREQYILQEVDPPKELVEELENVFKLEPVEKPSGVKEGADLKLQMKVMAANFKKLEEETNSKFVAAVKVAAKSKTAEDAANKRAYDLQMQLDRIDESGKKPAPKPKPKKTK